MDFMVLCIFIFKNILVGHEPERLEVMLQDWTSEAEVQKFGSLSEWVHHSSGL